jgi:hypothetical protein
MFLSEPKLRKEFDAFSNICRLFAKYYDDVEEAFPSIFSKFYTLETLEYLINEWVTEHNVNEYQWSSPLRCVALSMLSAGIHLQKDCSDGKRLIRRLVKMGADVHEATLDIGTILEQLMYTTGSPFVSKYLVTSGLKLFPRLV